MKILLVAFILSFLYINLYAQSISSLNNRTQIINKTVVTNREISGMIKDDSDKVVVGATVTLKSAVDTLRTVTNDDGVFIFKNVKENVFNITVTSIATIPYVKKYLFADKDKLIILDPIIISNKVTELKEVKINGTPSIIYKTDTVEYRAADYVVPPQATLDQLLKKMQGMEVSKNGTLTYQGQQVNEAKLNGKQFAGGDVAQAIQNLPADIVEKVQIIDDYGIQGSLTGIKEGLAEKVLNVTTKANRSIGTMGRINGQVGDDDRYDAGTFIERINANQEIGILGDISNTVNGVAPANNGNSSILNNAGYPGSTQSTSAALNYRDQLGKTVEVVSSYGYRNNSNNTEINNYGQQYSSLGTTDFNSQSKNLSGSSTQDLHLEIDYSIDSANYLQINPGYNYSNNSSSTNGSNENISHYKIGNEHELDNGTQNSLSDNNTFQLNSFYFHSFKKYKRSLSLFINLSHHTNTVNATSYKNYRYFSDSTQAHLVKDSVVNLASTLSNTNSTIQSIATYTEPLSKRSLLQFRTDFKTSFNKSDFIQDTVLTNGQLLNLGEDNNDYNYQNSESRISVSYSNIRKKTDLSLGLSALFYDISGTKVDGNAGISVDRSVYRFIPLFRFLYMASKTETVSINYTGNYNDPPFQFLLPYVDRTDPLNIKIGNPELQPSFSNTISAGYNNYIANSRLNISFNINATDVNQQITTNILQIITPLKSNGNTVGYSTVNEINYINLNGNSTFSSNYSIAKQLADRIYNLMLNGNITYNYSPAMSNNTLYHANGWKFDERFGPQITPNDDVEVNPFVEYNIANTFSSTPGAQATTYKIATLALDGDFNFLKDLQFNFNATKNFVTANTQPDAKNPFVINIGFKKDLLPKKNLSISFNAFDLLHQNSFLQQIATPQGVTNTVSNSLSRYFLIGVRLNLQKWNGVPTRDGKPMKRRGDGSFIY